MTDPTDTGILMERHLFASRLRAAREGAALSQRALQERSGVTQSHICDVEGAQCSPTVDTMARLAEALGVPLHEMLKP